MYFLFLFGLEGDAGSQRKCFRKVLCGGVRKHLLDYRTMIVTRDVELACFPKPTVFFPLIVGCLSFLGWTCGNGDPFAPKMDLLICVSENPIVSPQLSR